MIKQSRNALVFWTKRGISDGATWHCSSVYIGISRMMSRILMVPWPQMQSQGQTKVQATTGEKSNSRFAVSKQDNFFFWGPFSQTANKLK